MIRNQRYSLIFAFVFSISTLILGSLIGTNTLPAHAAPSFGIKEWSMLYNGKYLSLATRHRVSVPNSIPGTQRCVAVTNTVQNYAAQQIKVTMDFIDECSNALTSTYWSVNTPIYREGRKALIFSSEG